MGCTPRSKDYVVQFVLDRDLPTPLPRITLQAEEADFDEPHQLDEKHLPQFVQQMASRLDQRTGHDVAPLMLGSVPCAHYTKRKRFRFGDKTVAAECDVIQTLQNGRIYTLSLDVYSGKLIDYRADAYVVMAHIEFLEGAKQSDETASDAESGEKEKTQPAPEAPDQ